MTSAHEVAKHIIQKSSLPISNLKLQKLLYYAQGWHLAIFDEPLFSETIEAWVHGPVVPVVFREYREFRWSPIPVATTPAVLGSRASTHVRDVLKAYGSFTATQLEALSHSESPWIDARNRLQPKEPSKVAITHPSMKRYFSKQLNG
jgi:uncharacterized phage-associated protein